MVEHLYTAVMILSSTAKWTCSPTGTYYSLYMHTHVHRTVLSKVVLNFAQNKAAFAKLVPKLSPQILLGTRPPFTMSSMTTLYSVLHVKALQL